MRLMLAFVFLYRLAHANHPVFDYRTRMRVLLLPADLRTGSVVYRLRGTDAEFDYPLHFSVVDDVGKSIIRIENMPCNPTHTYCQANVFLARKLEPDKVYDLILSLKDSTGKETKVDSTIKATRGTSHFEDIFPYVPNVIMVSESTKVGTVLDYVVAKKNPMNSHHSYLELWGSEKFRIVQNLSTKDLTNGSIILTGELNYEEKSMYNLQVFCLDPFTKTSVDTRNIAGFQLPIIVQDDQDMPPEFNSLPPVTKISDKLKVGDKVLTVQAQDGDRGNPRAIKYSLVTAGNPIASFFNISEKSGDIYLAKPVEELATVARGSEPLLLTVSAEEIRKNQWEVQPMMATTQVALLLENGYSNSPPYFQSDQYEARITENSPQGTAVVFDESYSTVVKDDDSGKEGVFSLSLENNNGTFEISPSVGEQKANFMVRVRNNELLDFEERPYVIFTIIAKEVTPPKNSTSFLQSKADVVVYLEDQNDNPPVFLQEKYEAEIPENVTAGTVLTQVQAKDVDTGAFGKVHYTNILGNISQSLSIDPITGIISVATNDHGFDRESAQEYHLMVEAKDMEGTGNAATVPFIIKLLDVNDETPEFERQSFEFILQSNLRDFTSRAFVKATDKDAEAPNNVVRYEIISGNYENKFMINQITGELSLRGQLTNTNQQSDPQGTLYNAQSDGNEKNAASPIVLTVRAYDLGVPHRWTHTYVRIYPPESRTRNMNFIVSGTGEDRRKIEELLRQITGGRVIVQDVRPYTGRESGTDLSWKDDGSSDQKSVVSATVLYDGNAYVDLNQVEKRLTKNNTENIAKATVFEYNNQNRVLFWLMMFFFLLLLLILLILVLCCIWHGCCVCPWCEFDGKQIVSPTENIWFLANERNKRIDRKEIQGMTYYGRKEAWSGRNGERTSNYENPMREKLVRQIKIDGVDNIDVAGPTFRSHTNDENVGPNIIYTREFIRTEKDRNPTMVIEDVEINPYTAKTTTVKTTLDDFQRSTLRLNIHSSKDPDSDSIRRHEVERGSDMGKSFRKSEASPLRLTDGYQKSGQNVIKEYRVVLERPDENPSDDELIDIEQEDSGREHYYIKDGNTEILRLVTRGSNEGRSDVHELDQRFVKLEKGKDLLMKKFIEDQKQSTSNTEEFQQELLRRFQKEFEERHSEASYHRSIISEGTRRSKLVDSASNYDLDTKYMVYSFHNQETQSLPGQIEISTQTEREFGTQTEELNMLRPPRRKVRSDNEFSEDDEEDDYEDDKKLDVEKAVEALDLGKGWIPRQSKQFRTKKGRRYKMRTPILEEGETDLGLKYDTRPAMFKMPSSEPNVNGGGAYTENKTSILRRRKIKEKILEDEKTAGNESYSSGDDSILPKTTAKNRRSRRDLEKFQKEDELNKKLRSESLNRLYEVVQELGEGELERIKIETKERAASLNRFYNALVVFEEESGKEIKKSTSMNSLMSGKLSSEGDRNARSSAVKEERNSAMETENEKKSSNNEIEHSKQAKETTNSQSVHSVPDSNAVAQEAEKSTRGKKSKYMDWYNDLNTRKGKVRGKREKKKEDDLDSGIAMPNVVGSKQNDQTKSQQKTKSEKLLEKKSVFTIAYDGVKTKSIRPETNSSEKQ